MKSVNVEFLKDFVFSDNGVPYDCVSGACVKISEKSAEILCKRKVCKLKKANKKLAQLQICCDDYISEANHQERRYWGLLGHVAKVKKGQKEGSNEGR